MTDHPAPYSPEVLATLDTVIPEGSHVHDCYAGTGERLGAFCDEQGLTFSGTELAAAFIVDDRVRHGDATDPSTYPTVPYVLVTSPVYPNGIADDFHAQDDSDRRTYRSWHAKLVGGDEPLHPHNMGRWGYRGTSLSSPVRAQYWHLANKTVACWHGASFVLVNVSDFYWRNHREPVAQGWRRVLVRHGWIVTAVMEVKTRRWRNGSNRDRRVDHEVIMMAFPEHES